MAVYVDRIRNFGHALPGRHASCGRWANLFADTPEELDTFAAKLGFLRSEAYCRGTPERFHYELLPQTRAAAVRLGAIEVDDATSLLIWMRNVVAPTKRAYQKKPKNVFTT